MSISYIKMIRNGTTAGNQSSWSPRRSSSSSSYLHCVKLLGRYPQWTRSNLFLKLSRVPVLVFFSSLLFTSFSILHFLVISPHGVYRVTQQLPSLVCSVSFHTHAHTCFFAFVVSNSFHPPPRVAFSW